MTPDPLCALLAAALDAPLDTQVRGVLADWLEDASDERAGAVRNRADDVAFVEKLQGDLRRAWASETMAFLTVMDRVLLSDFVADALAGRLDDSHLAYPVEVWARPHVERAVADALRGMLTRPCRRCHGAGQVQNRPGRQLRILCSSCSGRGWTLRAATAEVSL